MSKNSRVVRPPKRQRAENGNAGAKGRAASSAGGTKRRTSGGGGGGRGGEQGYWNKLGRQFEVSSEEDKDEWSASDDEETEELNPSGVNYMRIANDDATRDQQDTASAIVQRWKQAQQKQQMLLSSGGGDDQGEGKAATTGGSGEKRKIEAVAAVAGDEDEDEDDDELPETDEFENVNGEVEEEEEAGGEETAATAAGDAEEDGGDDDDDEEGEAEEEAPRVRKGPGSVSFALVLGKLLSPDGQPAPQAAQDEAETAQPAVADPILMNFKRRTNRKLLAERRRRREARDLALKKKLLKARDHRIPTVLSEPGEVRLRKLATKGVVQLFNVVRKQQKEMAMQDTAELEKRNPIKAEKLTKTKFLELLQKTGGARKPGVKKEEQEDAIKKEQAAAKPAWDVLSDDYMLGASLKDLPDEADD